MADTTSTYANGTSLLIRYPWGVYVKAWVMCPDGKVRTTKRISDSDTFFSIPCAVEAKGRTVAGFITVVDTPDQTLVFHPKGANADVFGETVETSKTD